MITFAPVALVPDPEPGRCAYRTTDAATGATVRCANPAVYTQHGYKVCKACRDRPSGVLARDVVPVVEHDKEQG